jgi:hypothetical protein
MDTVGREEYLYYFSPVLRPDADDLHSTLKFFESTTQGLLQWKWKQDQIHFSKSNFSSEINFQRWRFSFNGSQLTICTTEDSKYSETRL